MKGSKSGPAFCNSKFPFIGLFGAWLVLLLVCPFIRIRPPFLSSVLSVYLPVCLSLFLIFLFDSTFLKRSSPKKGQKYVWNSVKILAYSLAYIHCQ